MGQACSCDTVIGSDAPLGRYRKLQPVLLPRISQAVVARVQKDMIFLKDIAEQSRKSGIMQITEADIRAKLEQTTLPVDLKDIEAQVARRKHIEDQVVRMSDAAQALEQQRSDVMVTGLLMRIFNEFDTNHDKSIGADEMAIGLRNVLNVVVQPQEMEELAAAYLKGTDRFQYDDFRQLLEEAAAVELKRIRDSNTQLNWSRDGGFKVDSLLEEKGNLMKKAQERDHSIARSSTHEGDEVESATRRTREVTFNNNVDVPSVTKSASPPKGADMTEVINRQKTIEAKKIKQLADFERQARDGLYVWGCPDVNYNGMYAVDPDIPQGNGQIHLKNEAGKHIYYGPDKDDVPFSGKWYMNNEFTPSKDVCKAFFATAEQQAPGAVTATTASAASEEWRYWDGTVWVTIMIDFAFGGAARKRQQEDRQRQVHHESRWKEQAKIGYYVTDAPDVDYNGLYRLADEECMANNRPHCVNSENKHMYYGPTGKWYLNNEYAPTKDTCKAFLATNGGVSGKYPWKYWDGVHEEWMDHVLDILHGDAAAQRYQEDDARESKLQDEIMQAAEVGGYYVSGCIATAYNGLYTVNRNGSNLCNKRPHLVNEETGYHLYCGAGGKWYLNNTFTPNEDTCKAYSDLVHGSIEGKNNWHYWDGVHEEWHPRAITVLTGSKAAEAGERDRQQKAEEAKMHIDNGAGRNKSKFMALVAATTDAQIEADEELEDDQAKVDRMWQFLDDSAAAAAASHSEASSQVPEHVPWDTGVDETHDSPPTLRLEKKRSRPAGGMVCCASTKAPNGQVE
jgi:hypothetical protein